MDEVIEISTLSDIVGCVPPESLDAFLADLGAWVRLKHDLADHPLVKAGVMVDPDPDVMKWVDDGKNDIDLNVHVVTEEEPGCGCHLE